MDGLPLPREHATPTHVRSTAWRHSHRAHQLLLEADALLDDETTGERARGDAYRLNGRARAHAEVAQALMACLDPARPRHEAGA